MASARLPGSILLMKNPGCLLGCGQGLDKALQSMSHPVSLPFRYLAWHRRMCLSNSYLQRLIRFCSRHRIPARGLPAVARANETKDSVTGMSQNRKQCNWIQSGNVIVPQVPTIVAENNALQRLLHALPAPLLRRPSICGLLFADGGVFNAKSTAQIWRVGALVLYRLTISARSFVDQSYACDTHHSAFLGATACSNSPAELTGMAEALSWICSFIPHGERVFFLRFQTRSSCDPGRRSRPKEHCLSA